VYVQALWNGAYFDYDNSKSSHQKSCMADQCAGAWFARSCGLELPIPTDKVRKALASVYAKNVIEFGAIAQSYDQKAGMANTVPLRGAANGMRAEGGIDQSSMQSCEMWTGTTFGLASIMFLEGQNNAAFDTMKGVYEGIYNTYGLWFCTPEAWLANGQFRSLGYMRPLAVWAFHWANIIRAKKGMKDLGDGSSPSSHPMSPVPQPKNDSPNEGIRRPVSPVHQERRMSSPVPQARVAPVLQARRTVSPAPQSRRTISPVPQPRRTVSPAPQSRRTISPVPPPRGVSPREVGDPRFR